MLLLFEVSGACNSVSIRMLGWVLCLLLLLASRIRKMLLLMVKLMLLLHEVLLMLHVVRLLLMMVLMLM